MRIHAALVLAAVAGAAAQAYEPTLERRAIEQALDVARSTIDATHRRFHADYRFRVAKPPLDFVEVVTPFRRVVLAADTSLRQGRKMFGLEESLAALQPDPAQVEIYAELTFHPLNTFVGVPAYDVELVPLDPRAGRATPESIDRFSRYGPRLDESRYPFPYPYKGQPGVPAGTQPLLGGTLVARFPGGAVDPKGMYQVVIKEGAVEIGRSGRIDLLRLR